MTREDFIRQVCRELREEGRTSAAFNIEQERAALLEKVEMVRMAERASPGPFPPGALKPEWEGDPAHAQTVAATDKQIEGFNESADPVEWVVYFTNPRTGARAQMFAVLRPYPEIQHPAPAPRDEGPRDDAPLATHVWRTHPTDGVIRCALCFTLLAHPFTGPECPAAPRAPEPESAPETEIP